MTDEEKQAIEIILNHQLEVPIPPRFVIQIMDARELAVFTDLFMAIEYPAELKKNISRAEINADTRVVTVTFKGKHTAMKWVGWTPPERIKAIQQNHSKRGKGSRDYVSRERPVTIEQLLEQVSGRKPRSNAKKEEQWRENGKDSSKENKRPTLPTEWEPARSTSGDPGESSRKEDKTLEASCDFDEGMEDAAMSEHENSETGPAYSYGYPSMTRTSTTHDPQVKAHETENAVQEVTKEQTGYQGSDTRKEGREPRQKASSPKRQLSENWKLHGDNKGDQTSKAAKKIKSEETENKRLKQDTNQTETNNQQEKKQIQQYIHKYVTTQTTSVTEARVSSTQAEISDESEALEKEGFHVTGTKQGDDFANVADEFKVHKEECEAALAAAGKGVTKQAADTAKLCALANHYADQRNRSVKASVPMNYWVRPKLIKAMAMHAREMVFVLDVLQEETVTLQAYGYKEMEMPDKTAIEPGTVVTLPSHVGADILRELTAAGTLPIIMVLHYSNAGNHYQAVTADKDAKAKGQESKNENTRADEGNTTQQVGEEEKQKKPSGSCYEWMHQDLATADAEVHKKQEIATITVGEASKSTTTAIRNAPTAHYPPSVTAATATKVPRNKEGIAYQDAKIAHGSVQPPKETNDGRKN
ncbi:uncharacterized protein PITG_14845 [Phytophthora infestans T30-4]|uniref:Uncharacterized protein n=1 Tax=Phytophthora infestans (strain T30-4) TaxID=403677 RepID=D0NP63_PHYIT|nr:uncharacterized protein PITG_14845 [Phytophthora infestans T30-4]EEY62405.1 conserved hypothetical protein [Phytophthora infestans T30-4]|eukprot:XP_002899041.1 conserved hypothetical protein [Phytophthora infestans T30-4]